MHGLQLPLVLQYVPTQQSPLLVQEPVDLHVDLHVAAAVQAGKDGQHPEESLQ
jgi:hypothetical protein